MTCSSVHRAIEARAAISGDVPALQTAGETLSYRDLNLRANGLARRLIASGLRRGSTAIVNMETSTEGVLVLLAVLKAGAAYSWIDSRDAASWPRGVSIAEGAGQEQRYRAVDLTGALADAQPGPNLPILTRPTDIACILSHGDGSPVVQVPHETITSLQARRRPDFVTWSGDADNIDLWIALIAGATVSVSDARLEAAAA